MFRWFKNLFWNAEDIDPPYTDLDDDLDGNDLVSDTPEGKLWAAIEAGECPDCHHSDGFLEGPSGGLSTNIECAHCHHRFNVTPIIGIAERIGNG